LILLIGGGVLSSQVLNKLLEPNTHDVLRVSNIEEFNNTTVSYQDYMAQFKSRNVKAICFFWKEVPAPNSPQESVFQLLQGCDLERVFFISSASVYGNKAGLLDSNSTVPQPIGEYGIEKLKLEDMIRNAFGNKSVVLRVANLFGHPDFSDLINKVIDVSDQGIPFELFAWPRSSRNFVNFQHVADFLFEALTGIGFKVKPIMDIGGAYSLPISSVLDYLQFLLKKELVLVQSHPDPSTIKESNLSCDEFNLWATKRGIKINFFEDLNTYVRSRTNTI
jgi:hypothetical protein